MTDICNPPLMWLGGRCYRMTGSCDPGDCKVTPGYTGEGEGEFMDQRPMEDIKDALTHDIERMDKGSQYPHDQTIGHHGGLGQALGPCPRKCLHSCPLINAHDRPANWRQCHSLGHTKFLPTLDSDVIIKQGQKSPISTRIQCITCMEEYENKSLEELRCEDYMGMRQLYLLDSSYGDDLRNKWFNKSASLKHILGAIRGIRN